MREVFKTLIVIFTVIGFFILYWLIGHKILMPACITDFCYYHNHDAPMIIEILFDFPSANGFHPVPTFLGYPIFGILGGLTGIFFNRILFRN